jgi:g-D-glutamyl-meso-diaminopimelate peptidase
LAYGYVNLGQAAYARQWKANALGVDLNRNFPTGWENSLEHPLPSISRYRGEHPLCAAESKALADYTQSRQFDATFSFHSHGSVLYYAYGNKQPVNDLSYSLALAMQAQTGYTPIGSGDGTSGAGYKDWAMDALGIPSLPVEIGSTQTPLETRDIYNTFARFEGLLPAISTWLARR